MVRGTFFRGEEIAFGLPLSYPALPQISPEGSALGRAGGWDAAKGRASVATARIGIFIAASIILRKIEVSLSKELGKCTVC